MIPIDNLEQFIQRIDTMPVDDLIRANKELCELRIARGGEIEQFHGRINCCEPVKRHVSPYWLLRVIVNPGTTKEQITAHLLGSEVITSDVMLIDTKKKLVRTMNSIYSIGDRGAADVSLHAKFRICAGLHHWGVGSFLEVPHVFY